MVSELARVRCELHPFAEIAVVAKLFDDNVDDTMNHVYDDDEEERIPILHFCERHYENVLIFASYPK